MFSLFKSKSVNYARFLKSKYDLTLSDAKMSAYMNSINKNNFSSAGEESLLEHFAAIHVYGMVKKSLELYLEDRLPSEIDLDFIIELNRRGDVIRNQASISLERCKDRNAIENSELYNEYCKAIKFLNAKIIEKFEIIYSDHEFVSDEISRILNS